MKVLISGAGIAGNALAFWLSKLGHDVTVIERSPNLRTTGLQLDLRGHGIEVMKRMGLEEAFRAKQVPEQGMQMVDKSGKRRAYFPASKSGNGPQTLTTEFEIMRGDLCRLMYNATKDRTMYVFGTSIECFEEKEDSVEVRFTDGKKDQFDLVVGADGQGSHIRKIMFGSDIEDAAYHPLQGVYMAYFTIPRMIQEGEEYIATTYLATGKRGIMTRRHSPHEIQVYIGCTSASKRLKDALLGGNAGEQKAAWAETFQGAGWQTKEIFESLMDVNTNFYCECPALVKLDNWSKGRVTLIGDAGYCPTVTTGMGTTSAIVGAYILAGEIRRHCGRSDGALADEVDDSKSSLATALEAYQRKFQPFMDQVQKGVSVSEETGILDKLVSSSFGIGIVNHLMSIASFFRLNLGRWSLKEEVKGWDLPVYEELLRD
jgi:2-polyprenyl-6-methoxyphenol hydroxylase-like FAD-dependent oxidoreductase